MPNSAAAIVSVIGAAAAIEHQWATVLACLTGSEIDAAMVLIQQLRSASTQEKAVIELVKLKLDVEEAEIVKTASRAMSAHRQRRNDFAHGLWAQPMLEPDRLVLLRGSNVRRFYADLVAFTLHGSMKDVEFGTTAEERDFYGAADFDAALLEASEAYELMSLVTNFVMAAAMEKQKHPAAFGQAAHAKAGLLQNRSFQAVRRK